MFEPEPPVKCSTPCQDGFDGHVDSSILLSPCAPPCISNCRGTPDVAMVSGTWAVAAGAPRTCVQGHPGKVGFPPTSPFSAFLISSISHVSHRGHRAAGECLGALIMCNITETSIYAPVDHNTNRNMSVAESV